MIERIDGELHARAKAGPRVKVLGTLPGVGEFTALMMLAEIDGITRFGSARKLASRAGLTPAARGSDLTVRHGRISGQGPAWLRWVLNQAAQTARRSPEFPATCAAIAKRRGKKIATIAIARKLLTRAYPLDTNGPYGCRELRSTSRRDTKGWQVCVPGIDRAGEGTGAAWGAG